MADNTINIEELLMPVSEAQPAGVDLRQNETADSLYYQLKDARNSARAIERNSFPGDGNDEHLEKEHWKLILQKAPQALKESKDLEIAAWLTEALIRQYGFASLKAGFSLINGLVKNFWNGLYPLPDEDGIGNRVAVLVGLNGINNTIGTLIAPINTAPLTADGLYSAWSFSQAQELEKIKEPAARKKKTDTGVVPLATIKAAVKPSQSEFYFDLASDIQTAQDQFNQLTETLNQLCGDETPPTTNIRKSLENAQKALNFIAKDILNPEASVPADENTEENQQDSSFLAQPGHDLKMTGNFKGRLEAFKTLQAVADFFKRSEPHSPIGYAIERVVRWGDMSLPELLQELVPDPQAKDYYQKLVGILPPPPPNMNQPQAGIDPMMQDHYNGQYNNPQMGMDQGYGGGSDFQQPAGGYDNPLFK